ncbi:Imm8 family immunity protein [Erwinia aphidicola]|uniref:Imm8 family immunity protein n=1 Tax=Erwinia aphidicola TaxID=68334 RepID=UPI0030D03391
MKTILKSISNDDCLLNTFDPEDENVFSLRLLLRIGAENSSEADNFDLFVCTPEWLCKHQWLPELMRHTLRARKNYQGSLPGNMKTISLKRHISPLSGGISLHEARNGSEPKSVNRTLCRGDKHLDSGGAYSAAS